MGAFVFVGAGMLPKCEGQDVLAELDNVFSDPTRERYKYAKQNNIFDTVHSGQHNYRALIAAYTEAGVDVCARWAAYLRKLGAGAQGQQDIHEIAQTRYKALKSGVPMQTLIHDRSDGPHGGGHVKKHDGSGGHDPSTINSPFPLPP
jgi:hypothetical protein